MFIVDELHPKYKNILKEDYGRKKYIDENKIEDVRFMFKGGVGLLPFAGNYSNDEDSQRQIGYVDAAKKKKKLT